MNIELVVISSLLVLTNLYWMYHSQKLVDKIMSRDFTEYRTAEIKEPVKRPEKVQQGVPENLGPLQDFVL